MKNFLLAGMLLLVASGPSQLVAQQDLGSWKITYSPGMPARMEEGERGSFYFDFPPKDGVHYVTSAAPSVHLNQTITMRFAIVGDGKLVPTQGNTPARVRLFLQQRGDQMTVSEPFKRWWSVAYVALAGAHEFTLIARLVPSQWSSVFGKVGSAVPNEFETAMVSLDKIGFTFGGTFAGHGVYVTGGTARFILKSFTITFEPK